MMKLLSTFAAVLRAPADAARAGSADPTLEIVTFRLTDGADEMAFVEAAKGTEAWLESTGEVVARSLSVDDDGLWTDAITWRTRAKALAVAKEAMAQPEFAPLMALIDPDTVNLRHAAILWQMD